ncbi:hypothetical protein AAL_06256 [Moelleriella libera RCEF 2490]|uniref:UMTA methyltransferase family protein n=1 Tax=Moelleriella libera RCEF 2490 TaxID=1081109 RepID=A0A167Z1U2_9HYPO|nr:hypothetical protein AAL_06256 [Moelleriella libera RCEF 2490]
MPELKSCDEATTDVAKPEDSYALLRDCNASSRLTAQHFLWKDLLGFLVHPDIPTRAADLKVADVATGNGVWQGGFIPASSHEAETEHFAAPSIWLQDLARDRPSPAEFHGFDISLDQVGPRQWVPANVQYHQWNLFEEPPQAFVGYFDVVHVRLITVVVKNNDPRPVIANLIKLLKPGGHLQWDEVDTIGCSIKAVPGAAAASNLDVLFNQLKGSDTWKYELCAILDTNGCKDSQIHAYEYGLGFARLWSDIYVSTWKEFAENVLKTPAESRELESKAMADTRNGAAIMVPKLVWVATKR